jgi:rubrerythrin
MTRTGIQITARHRVVGLERRYHCDSCGGEHRSWERSAHCPSCGEPFVAAVIRRAAVSS